MLLAQKTWTSLCLTAVALSTAHSAFPQANVGPPRLLCTPTAAARLLDQATFGPTASDINVVQRTGLQQYLTQQFASTPTLLPQFGLQVPAPCDSQETCWGSVWWKAVLTSPDQLRQRVAFALSHIFVVSTNVVGGYAMVPYYNILLRDAFSNWRTLMQDVTLSPTMGEFLNMANSAAAPAGQIANENYARENMQLFNIGTVLLNEDGTLRHDAQGNTIPAYSQAQVQSFARAFTGWTYPTASGTSQNTFGVPMLAIESQHDMQPKGLLSGVTLSGGQTAEQDLKDALDNIFQHPNLPPFISRHLIQTLVTSNPSPAYVARIANVFVNDGRGVRGDMKAVIEAILLDPEARMGDWQEMGTGGHLREPLLFMANVLRAIPYAPTDTADDWGYWSLSLASSPAGEAPMQAPSVFGYFPGGFVIPGTTLSGPEFGLESVANVSSRKVLVDRLLSNGLLNMKSTLSTANDFQALAANPDHLVDQIDLIFMHDQMPLRMKRIIVNAIAPLSDPGQRVRIALDITLTSSQYKIIH